MYSICLLIYIFLLDDHENIITVTWEVSQSVQCNKGTPVLRKTIKWQPWRNQTLWQVTLDIPPWSEFRWEFQFGGQWGASTATLYKRLNPSIKRAKTCCTSMLISQPWCLLGNWGETGAPDVWEVSVPSGTHASTWWTVHLGSQSGHSHPRALDHCAGAKSGSQCQTLGGSSSSGPHSSPSGASGDRLPLCLT